MLIKIILISLLGSFLCLDRICLQLMISRPIVTAPIIGLVLGDIRTGLIIGAFLELLWVDRPALGNYIPPNDSLLAVFITAAAILAGFQLGDASRSLLAFSLLLFLPMSYVTQIIDTRLTASNDKLSDGALEDAKAGDIRGIERKHLLALLKAFVTSAAFIFACTALGAMLLIYLYPKLPVSAINALNLVYFAFPVLLVAVALNTIKMRRDFLMFCAIFIAASLLFEIFYGF